MEAEVHNDPAEQADGVPPPVPEPEATAKVAEIGQKVLKTGAGQARAIFNDLKTVSFKEEVLPIDASNLTALAVDFVFWAVTLLGVIPLLIVSIEGIDTQLTLFALFFAAVWGVIIKMFVMRDESTWAFPVASLFFTGIIGLFVLIAIYRYLLPDFYLNWADSESPLVSLFGYVFQVGVWEEVFKALPVVLFLWWKKDKAHPMALVGIGVFSGLGFAAFENLQYGDRAVASADYLAEMYGEEGLMAGVQSAMITTMLRSLSLVFCHAIWAGIAAYFIAVASIERRRVAALIIVGILVAAVLHGAYDWFTGVQMTLAAATAGFSFALFYGYLSKLRGMIDAKEAEAVAEAAGVAEPGTP